MVVSKSFDNGMICASEQAVILDVEIRDAAIQEFRRLKAHLATGEEKILLERHLFGVGEDRNCAGAKLNAAVVGRSAAQIADAAGFSVPADTSVILVEAEHVGPDEPLTREKLCPVLAVLTADSRSRGVELAVAMVEFHGLGHSAAVHTEDEAFAEEFGHAVKACRVIWNAPSSQGGIGDVYNAFMPSLTLGCGSYGANSVSGNVTALNLVNIKRIGRRNTNMQWFKIPPKVFFERNSVKYLADMRGARKVVIVTDRTMVEIGHVERVRSVLARRSEPVEVRVIDFVEPNPSIDTVEKGAELMRGFRPDTIIALGGGSPMDAAKVMWLMYEHPETVFADLKEKFFDIRKRAFTFPDLGERAKLVCIPTTSGTGSEVTPFAVITDSATGQKYPLADYALTPSVAICDPALTTNLPKDVTADSGFDALTHCIETYVSVYANDFTDGLALQGIKLIFENLEQGRHRRPEQPGGPGEDAQRRDHRRDGLRLRLPRRGARDGAHPGRHLPRRARPDQRDPAAAGDPLQRRGPVQGDQLAQVPELRGPGAVPGDREDARPAGREPGAGRGVAGAGGRGAAGQGRHPGLLQGGGGRRGVVPGGAAAAGDVRLRGPVRPGQPADADDRRHAAADAAGLLRRPGLRPAEAQSPYESGPSEPM
ncbi:hypothetical protein GCM10020229_41730 [Kitasatospora albolonga]